MTTQRVTGKVSLRTLALESDPDAPNVLAVRAADLLRSSLREFAQDQRPPPEVVGVDRGPAPELVRRWASTPRPRFHLDARVAALGLAERIGAGFGPSLAFRYDAFDRLAVGAVVVGPALGAARATELGTASISQELALARISWAIIASSVYELSPLLGAGVYHLDARGEVDAPLVGRDAQVTSFAGALGVDAELRLVGALSLGAEASALTLSPRPGVAVREQQYLFAWPFVTASVGIGVAF